MGMPERASTTLRAQLSPSRFAKDAIKAGGMCCTRKKLAGTSAGICGSTSCSVAGPPVEMPMTTALFLVTFSNVARTGGRYGWRRSRLRCKRSTMPRDAAALSFEISSSATTPRLAETVPSGLPTKSKAPNSRHSKVVAAPFWVSDETITTGQIFSWRIICRAVMPSNFGMLMSIEMTSGRSSRAFNTASSPSRASPTKSRSADTAMIRLRVCRIKAESSATSTRILFMVFKWYRSGPRGYPGRGSDRSRDRRERLALRGNLGKMRLLLLGENLLHVEQHDHAFTRIHLADSGNEMLIDSTADRFRRRGDVLRGEIQHLAHGIHYQAGFDAAEIHDDDARAVVGRFDLEIEALACVQHRDYFASEVGNALDERGGLRHLGDLGEAVDLLDLRDRDSVFLGAEHERDQLNFAQFLRTRCFVSPGLLRFNGLASGALDIP